MKQIRKNNFANKLKDVPGFILGNAPSINDQDLHSLDGLFTVGVNRIFLKYETTVLLWQDRKIWDECGTHLTTLDSLLYAREGSFISNSDRSKLVYSWKLQNNNNYSLIDGSTTKYSGRGSSGLIAFKFMHSLGCNPIILVGMDCRYEGEKTDFWGVNKDHKPTTLHYCNEGLKIMTLTDRKVISCSNNKIFSTKKLEDVVKLYKNSKHDNKYYINKLIT